MKESPSFCVLKSITIPRLLPTVTEHGEYIKPGTFSGQNTGSRCPQEACWTPLDCRFWGASFHSVPYLSVLHCRTDLHCGLTAHPAFLAPTQCFSRIGICSHKILAHLTPSWHLLLRGPGLKHTYNRKYNMLFETVTLLSHVLFVEDSDVHLQNCLS